VGRLIFLIFSITYLVGAFISDGIVLCLMVLVYLVLPCACIWFSDEIGSYKGYARGLSYINVESPGCLVAFMGWVFLLIPLVIYVVESIYKQK
jgi:hypothetical protein